MNFTGIYKYQINNNSVELNENSLTREVLVKTFIWAQWHPLQQTLYYIHNRKRTKCLVENDEENFEEENSRLSPTLSGLQFNDELPHETVVRNNHQLI